MGEQRRDDRGRGGKIDIKNLAGRVATKKRSLYTTTERSGRSEVWQRRGGKSDHSDRKREITPGNVGVKWGMEKKIGRPRSIRCRRRGKGRF